MKLIPAWAQALILLALVALIFGAGWWTRGLQAEVKLAKTEAKVEADRATRTEAARQDEQLTADKEHKHAKLTMDAVARYTYAAPQQGYELRARLDAAQRLHRGAEGRAARYLAQAEAGGAACRALADRASALDRSLAEGRLVVEELRGVVVRRDAQVALLLDLNDALHELLEAP